MVTTANWYSCNVGVVSRSKARTAIGAAAYITGTCLYDRELEASPSYEPSDYRRKGGVEQWFITAPDTAPEWAFEIEALCNEAQVKDTRKNSCTARVARFSLPYWADAEGREQITREVSEYLADRYGVAVIAGIHAPDRHGDDRNWHSHMWFTTREVDEHGLGAKTRVLDDKKTGPQEIVHIREAVADIINRYMEEAGADEQVDHRSYKDRGMERIPTEHLGSAASALERRGIRTERGDRNRAIQECNARLDRIVEEMMAVDAEIARELEREFIGAESESEEQKGVEWEVTITSEGRQEWTLMLDGEAVYQERADPDSAFTSAAARAYLESEAETELPEQMNPPEVSSGKNGSAFASPAAHAYMEAGARSQEEEQRQSERRWYEELYTLAVETVQHYWSRFVDRIQRRDREREDFEPER